MKSVRIDRQDIRNYDWGERLPSHTVQYADVINFERTSTKQNRCCVLCGDKEGNGQPGSGCLIPKQNKGVCRECDSTYWLLKKLGVVVKFCKGCKLFFSLVDFDGKPNTTKCGVCRKRGRDNYHGKMERKRHCELAGSRGCSGSDSDSVTTVEEEDEEDDAGGFGVAASLGGGPPSKKRKLALPLPRPPLKSCSTFGWAKRVGNHTLCPEEESSEDSVVAILLGMDSLRDGGSHAPLVHSAPPAVAGPWSLLSSAEREKAVELVAGPSAEQDCKVEALAARSPTAAALQLQPLAPQSLSVTAPRTLSTMPTLSAVCTPRTVNAAQVMQLMRNDATAV